MRHKWNHRLPFLHGHNSAINFADLTKLGRILLYMCISFAISAYTIDFGFSELSSKYKLSTFLYTLLWPQRALLSQMCIAKSEIKQAPMEHFEQLEKTMKCIWHRFNMTIYTISLLILLCHCQPRKLCYYIFTDNSLKNNSIEFRRFQTQPAS